MAKLTEIAWEAFERLPLEAKRPYLENDAIPNTPYHTLFAQQFDRSLLERLAALALARDFGIGDESYVTSPMPDYAYKTEDGVVVHFVNVGGPHVNIDYQEA